MIALDTNVLVRALVDDPGEVRQCAAARAALRQAGEAFVPQAVQVETVWVLESAHGLPKPEIVSILEHLQENGAFHLQEPAQFAAALADFRRGGADFSDYLILAGARARGVPLLSFDRRLLKAAGTRAP